MTSRDNSMASRSGASGFKPDDLSLPWPKIAVVGAGAVGGYFGGMLARAGAPVVMIGRASVVEAIQKNGLVLDTVQFKQTVRVEASTEMEAARGADIVLFCVKTTDTESTARPP